MGRWTWRASALLWVGCASAPAGTDGAWTPDDGVVSSRISAARMYQTAEAMVDEGYYADAVRLMRHSILSLPRTQDTDDLRHALRQRLLRGLAV